MSEFHIDATIGHGFQGVAEGQPLHVETIITRRERQGSAPCHPNGVAEDLRGEQGCAQRRRKVAHPP
jgi:hypothetical protein